MHTEEKSPDKELNDTDKNTNSANHSKRIPLKKSMENKSTEKTARKFQGKAKTKKPRAGKARGGRENPSKYFGEGRISYQLLFICLQIWKADR